MTKGRHTASSTRGRDDARELSDNEAAAPSSIWAHVRAMYPPRVQEFVDEVVAQGGLSLADIEALECAEHERLLGIFAQLQKQDADARAINPDARGHWTALTSLMHLRIQSRKHLRTLRLCMSPIATPNETHPDFPAGVAARLERQIVDGDMNDLGDDLLPN